MVSAARCVRCFLVRKDIGGLTRDARQERKKKTDQSADAAGEEFQKRLVAVPRNADETDKARDEAVVDLAFGGLGPDPLAREGAAVEPHFFGAVGEKHAYFEGHVFQKRHARAEDVRFASGRNFNEELVPFGEVLERFGIDFETEVLLREFAKPRGERVGKLFPASHADADVERHAREAVLLHLFHGDRGGSAEDDEVVENPAEVDEEGRDLRVGGDDRLVDADGEPREIERDQNEDGLRDSPVDVLLVDRHALGRDVELPFVREDEGDGRR